MPRTRPMMSHPTAPPSRAASDGPYWSTSSIDSAADTSPMDLSALGAHVDRCNGSRGRWFELQCAADALSGFLAPRLVTTLVVVGLIFGVGSLIF